MMKCNHPCTLDSSHGSDKRPPQCNPKPPKPGNANRGQLQLWHINNMTPKKEPWQAKVTFASANLDLRLLVVHVAGLQCRELCEVLCKAGVWGFFFRLFVYVVVLSFCTYLNSLLACIRYTYTSAALCNAEVVPFRYGISMFGFAQKSQAAGLHEGILNLSALLLYSIRTCQPI